VQIIEFEEVAARPAAETAGAAIAVLRAEEGIDGPVGREVDAGVGVKSALELEVMIHREQARGASRQRFKKYRVMSPQVVSRVACRS
jgi:hypothetical protein